MKSILLSINPKWCEKIASGEKTIEVRKTRPKLEMPFKVYIYCTQDKKFNFCTDNGEQYTHIGNGKVIGEFGCDEMYSWNCDIHDYDSIALEALSELSCVSEDDLLKYADRGNLYGWHISDLVIYDKPRELSEFFVADNIAVQSCEHRQIVGQPEYKTNHNGWIKGSYVCNKSGEPDWCSKCKTKALSRPPQSWCYVEEVHNGTENADSM